MRKYTFVFPGQGAQFVGMTKEFYEIPQYKSYFEQANSRLGYDLKKIMFHGPAKELKQTYNTQPAILLHSTLALKHFCAQSNIKPDLVAGHSLGEFSALIAAGVLHWLDALYLVHKRGKFMVEANDDTSYKMAAILGLDHKIIEDICLNTEGVVVPANFNTPQQTVISGEKNAVIKTMQKCKEQGAKRIVPLVVGGAFHSPLIKKSAEWLLAEMKNINFNKAKIPVISNYNAKPEIEPKEIISNLRNQIISPVRWVDCVNYMIDYNITTVIEFGPKNIISRMIKSIDKNIEIFNISQPQDVNGILKKLKE